MTILIASLTKMKQVHYKIMYLPSSSPLPKPYVKLVIQQLLIVSTHINGYRQALKMVANLSAITGDKIKPT